MGALDDLLASTETKQSPQTSALDSLMARYSDKPKSMSWGDVADDTMRATISGTIRGLVGLAGLPGDAIYGARWLANKAGLPTVNTPMPGSEEIGGAVKNVLGGDYSYAPKTVAGEVAETAAGFAPVALGGGGGVIRQGANVLGTALASKTAGDAGRLVSPELGIAGDIGGALLGAHRLGQPTLPKAPKPTAADITASELSPVTGPGTEAVKRISQENYLAADKAGVAISGNSFYNFLQNLRGDSRVRKLFLNPTLHPKLAGVTDEILQSVPSPMAPMTGAPTKNISLEQFDHFRQSLLEAARSPVQAERAIADHLIGRMDAYFNGLKQSDVTGNLQAARKHILEARKNWRIYRKSEEIDKIMEVAKDRAGQYSVSGNENAIRTGFRQLSVKITKDPRTAALFTPDEIKMIRQLSRGRWSPRNALRIIGKLSPNVFTLGAQAGGAGASYATGDPRYLALTMGMMGAGAASRAASGALARRKVDALSQLVRGGGKMRGGSQALVPLAGGTAFERQKPY